MLPFASPEKFADIVKTGIAAFVIGKTPEDLFAGVFVDPCGATADQARAAGKVTAGLFRRYADSDQPVEFDILAPTNTVAGRWTRADSAKADTTKTLEYYVFYENLLGFIHVTRTLTRRPGTAVASTVTERREQGVFVAGFDGDVCTVALCGDDGSVREMQIMGGTDRAVIGGVPFTNS